MVPVSSPRPAVNMPALVGVVVVVLAGIVAWVLSGQMGSDQVAVTPGTTVATTVPGATTVATTSPPSTVPDPTTIPATTVADAPAGVVSDETTPVPLATNVGNEGGQGVVTTTTGASTPDAGASGGAGDLGIDGHPIQKPTCDGAFVTVVASAVGKEVSAASILQLLNAYDGSNYLRTDQSCASFAQSQNGEPIYVVYLGPFAQPADACAARSKRPNGAYVKRLSDDPNAGGANC